MSREKPLPKQIREFVEHHLAEKKYRREVFAPFTGQDYAAWSAFVYLLRLYGCGDYTARDQAIIAMRACVASAQPSVLAMFKKAIPGCLDWSDEPKLWALIAPKNRTDGELRWPCADGERNCTNPAHAKPNPARPTESVECPDCGSIFVFRQAVSP